MFWDKWKEDNEDLKQSLLEAQMALEAMKLQKLPPKIEERVADLEIKMAKLWGLLLETSATGKDKLTKHGKFFGGQAKDRL